MNLIDVKIGDILKHPGYPDSTNPIKYFDDINKKIIFENNSYISFEELDGFELCKNYKFDNDIRDLLDV